MTVAVRCPLPPTSDLPIPLEALKAYNEYGRRVLDSHGPVPLEKRLCPECRVAVAADAPARKVYCGYGCQQAAYRRTHPERWRMGRAKPPRKGACPVCGADLTGVGKYLGVATYCSPRCREDAKNARKRAARAR